MRRSPVQEADRADSARFAFGLTPAEVEEFRELIHSECGENLGPEEAWKRASEVLALFRMLLGPLPEDHAENSYPQALVLTDRAGDRMN